MKRRILFPGELHKGDVILVTGAVYSATISHACGALKEGIEAKGFSAAVCALAAARVTSEATHLGSPGDWQAAADVLVLDLGEFLGPGGFRCGGLYPGINKTRTLFLTPVAEPAVAHVIELDWERERREAVLDYLEEYLPGPIHLVRPSLVRPAPSEMMLADTQTDILAALERGEAPDPKLLHQRQVWRDLRDMDRVPMLERQLW